MSGVLGIQRAFCTSQWHRGKESSCQCRRCERHGFDHWIGKIPWRMKWQPAPVFLPGKSHGQRNLVDCSPWGLTESDTTEHARTHTHALSLSLRRQEEPPPSRMPDLVIPLSSFQEKHTLGKRWGFFSPAVLCISQPWFCCFAISPLPGVGVSSFLDVP